MHLILWPVLYVACGITTFRVWCKIKGVVYFKRGRSNSCNGMFHSEGYHVHGWKCGTYCNHHYIKRALVESIVGWWFIILVTLIKRIGTEMYYISTNGIDLIIPSQYKILPEPYSPGNAMTQIKALDKYETEANEEVERMLS